jgi:hypothetical protein
MAVVCMVCPCVHSKAATADAGMSGEAPVSGTNGCLQCRANSDAQPPQRLVLSEDHNRISATTTDRVCLRDNGALEQRAASAATLALTGLDVPNLQVFLE